MLLLLTEHCLLAQPAFPFSQQSSFGKWTENPSLQNCLPLPPHSLGTVDDKAGKNNFLGACDFFTVTHHEARIRLGAALFPLVLRLFLHTTPVSVPLVRHSRQALGQEQQEQQHNQDVLARRSGAGRRAGDMEDRGEFGRLLCVRECFFHESKKWAWPRRGLRKNLAILVMAFVWICVGGYVLHTSFRIFCHICSLGFWLIFKCEFPLPKLNSLYFRCQKKVIIFSRSDTKYSLPWPTFIINLLISLTSCADCSCAVWQHWLMHEPRKKNTCSRICIYRLFPKNKYIFCTTFAFFSF